MKAVQFNRFGGPEVLEIVDLPTPVAQAGEVLVKVRAAGINCFEVLMRADKELRAKCAAQEQAIAAQREQAARLSV